MRMATKKGYCTAPADASPQPLARGMRPRLALPWLSTAGKVLPVRCSLALGTVKHSRSHSNGKRKDKMLSSATLLWLEVAGKRPVQPAQMKCLSPSGPALHRLHMGRLLGA